MTANGWLQLVLILGALVVIHELGHFVTARLMARQRVDPTAGLNRPRLASCGDRSR